MNQMNMAALNAGGAAMGGMPVMNNGANGAVTGPVEGMAADPNYEAKLNTFMYNHFISRRQWDMARSLKNSGVPFDPPILHGEGAINGTDDRSDAKDGVDEKRPSDLPEVKSTEGSFLLNWFSLFWDIWFAQRKTPNATANASQYVQYTQQQARARNEQQQQLLRGVPGMMPGGMNRMNEFQMMQFQNGMGMNGDIRKQALQNRQNGFQPTPQQLQHFRQQQQHQMLQQNMRRDPSNLDVNGQRPHTPSAGDHAPSPSKRQRIDGAPFNQQMIPNGRGPPPGMPGQMMGGGDQQSQHANQLLLNNGINPANLSDSQFQSFQQQVPMPGAMSDQESPLMGQNMELAGPEFYGANPTQMQMRGGGMPPGGPGGAGGNHALQDYQMQLMLLEQQNKKRLAMARHEQDTITRPDGQPGMPAAPGYAPGMSPSGSRGGPSPGPEIRRGTPKMHQQGLPGSPMPDGSVRGSPAAMNFNGMNPDVYAQMNNGMRQPPSSNPAFNGQFNPQQMEAMQRAQNGVRMPNGNWQPGSQGQTPMIQQPQPQQPSQMGTPQQRNDMPPPQGVPTGAASNGRPGSPAAPPTPQQANKPNPKKKNDKKRERPQKKGSTASVAATPNAAEAENPPATPTPSTPITPSHPSSFAPKNEATGNTMQGVPPTASQQLAAPQPDLNTMPQMTNFDGTDGEISMTFNTDFTGNTDVLENFDFDQFITDEAFTFDTPFPNGDGMEPVMGDA